MSLILERVGCGYGDADVVRDVSLTVAPGQVLCLLGRNGAGKTTTLKAVMGLVPVRSGRIMLGDETLSRLAPHKIPRLGVAYVPQGRGLFPRLSVGENLEMGLAIRRGPDDPRPWIFELFPAIRARLSQQAGTLSGGEQQMVATARALCADPAFLLMDEPFEGLMPTLVHTLQDAIRALRARGVGVLLVEQRLDVALAVADAAAVMETGRIRASGPVEVLARDSALLARYLGVRR